MPFTVTDFQDLLRLLREHPDWRAQLWATLAGEELLRLPGEFRVFREEIERRLAALTQALQELAEAQRRHYEEFAAHRQEFLAYRAETDRRFAELAEAQRRHYEEFAAYRAETDRRFAELAEAQRRAEERIGRLEEAMAALAEAQRRHYEEFAAHRQEFLAYRAETDQRFAELAEEVRKLAEAQRRTEKRVLGIEGRLRGGEVEAEYRRIHRRYRHLVRDPYVLSLEEQRDLVKALEERGAIDPDEGEELEAADALVRGRRREGEGEAILVVEISAVVHTGDVERAARRAAALQKALPEMEVRAVVAGPEIHPRARAIARERGVWWLTDGRAFAPHEIPGEPPPRSGGL